ncbi:MAG TPA: metallophosphoesterase [Sedimentisphaerales bacterium]|nr:metallophosphoesterase [Sedimentisphaerales bacterium]
MIVAVFGDVHGNLPGMYRLARNWERKERLQIDLVLQTGDIGLWTCLEQMDRSTKKRSQEDRSQLAAAPYISGETTAPIETWFVHGNHENFSLLADKEDRAVDPGGRIIFLAPGSVREFHKGNETLTVAALGGMEYRFGKFPMPSDERVQKYLHPASLEELLNKSPKADVLLLHDAPLNKGLRNKFPTGSKRITRLIEAVQPRFAFYGHYDDPPDPFYIGHTLCAGMNLARAKRIPNRDGAMAILRTDNWEFHFVEAG